MKTNHHTVSTAHETFASIIIAGFLILVAWGNAIAMLVFSLVGLAVWFMLPETQEGGESSDHRGLLTVVIAAAVAFVVAAMLTILQGS